MRSHFYISQPKALRSKARGYLSELRRATCPVESHSSFCSPFSPAEFLAAASNLFSSTATGPDKVAYSMLKHLPRSGMDLLLYIFNLSWSLHSFPFIWKTSSIIPIHKMGKPLDSPASFRSISRSGMDLLLYIFNLSWSLHSFPFIWKTSSIIPIHKMGKPLDSPASFRSISLTSCVSKLFERIILSRLLFFLESNSILSPRQAGFRPGRSTLDQILYLSPSISDGFNKPRPGSRTILSTIDFSKAFDSVWHPALFHKLISPLVWFIKITKAAPFEVFRKDPFLDLYFSLYSLMIFRPLCLLPSAVLFTLTIWLFGPLLLLGPHGGGGHTRSSVSIGELV